MTEQTVLDVATKAIWVTMQVSAPALLATLVVGLVVSIMQAATQISEQTLSFIPKVLAITVAMILCGPWIMHVMMGFTIELFNGIPTMTH